MIAQPFLDFFALSGDNDALPSYNACPLAVFRHNVRTFVQYLNRTFRLGAPERKRRSRRMVFFHVSPG